MPRIKLEPLAWPSQATGQVIAEDRSGDATTAILAELEAGHVVASGNAVTLRDPQMREKYEVIADGFRRAQAIVAKLWQDAHSQHVVPPGFRPYIHPTDAAGVFNQRS